MANFSFIPTAGLTITGIVPAAGPTSTDKITAAFSGVAVSADDRLSATFIVNASTDHTAIDLGKIVEGSVLWLECDGPLHVTITQDLGAGPVDAVVLVEKFLFHQSSFTGLKVKNPSATTAVHLSVVIAGDRAPVGGGAGVF